MNKDRDAYMADVLAFQCAHAVPEAKPCADFGRLCPFMVHTNSNATPFVKPKCADVTPAMWLKEIRWLREQEAKHGRI
jgi:hypothetical protein